MGWQVSWLAGQCSLPPSRSVACGQESVASGKCSPLTVAGAAVGLHRAPCGARCVPHSLIALSFERGHQRAVVQRCALALSMGGTNSRGSLAPNGRPRVALLSLPALCITLNALSGARYQLHWVGE